MTIERAIDGGALDLWVDLSAATSMDSSGVHCLCAAHARCESLNRRLVIICADGPVAALLSLMADDRDLDVCASRAEAQRLS